MTNKSGDRGATLGWKRIIADGDPKSPSPSFGAQAVWTGTKMLLFGGEEWGKPAEGEREFPYLHYFQEVWSYNHTEGWKQLWQNVNIDEGPYFKFASIVWSGKEVIFFGGREDRKDHENFTNDVWCYNPETNKFTKEEVIGNKPSPRDSSDVFWYNGEIFIYDGWNINDTGNSVRCHDMWAYNFENKIWREIKPQNEGPKISIGIDYTIWNGEELVVFSDRLAYNWVYNPKANMWRQIPEIPESRNPKYKWLLELPTNRPVWDGERIWLVGAQVGSDYCPIDIHKFWIYRPSSNKWVEIRDNAYPEPRNGAAMVWTGKEILLFGGVKDLYLKSRKYFNDLWSYTPSPESEK